MYKYYIKFVRIKPETTSKTTSKIPPPGPSLRTFGTKPLYNAAKPSSRATMATPGSVQLYFPPGPIWF